MTCPEKLSLSETLNRCYRMALLLTDNSEAAEAAVREGIEQLRVCERPEQWLLYRTVAAILRASPEQRSNEQPVGLWAGQWTSHRQERPSYVTQEI